jgi:hypothetical protein
MAALLLSKKILREENFFLVDVHLRCQALGLCGNSTLVEANQTLKLASLHS